MSSLRRSFWASKQCIHVGAAEWHRPAPMIQLCFGKNDTTAPNIQLETSLGTKTFQPIACTLASRMPGTEDMHGIQVLGIPNEDRPISVHGLDCSNLPVALIWRDKPWLKFDFLKVFVTLRCSIYLINLGCSSRHDHNLFTKYKLIHKINETSTKTLSVCQESICNISPVSLTDCDNSWTYPNQHVCCV